MGEYLGDSFLASFSKQLEAERERVRVLREGMTRIIDEADHMAEALEIADKALATTKPEDV